MKKKLFSILLILCLLVSVAPSVFAAASCGVNASNYSPTVGNRFTVSVTISSPGGIFGHKTVITYDPSVLKFISGDNANGGAGTITALGYASNTSTTSLSFSLTFEAAAAGSSGINVVVSEAYDANDQSLGNPSGSVTVTVKNNSGGGTGGGGTGGGTGGGSTPPKPPEKTEVEKAIPVTIGSSTLYLWHDISNITLPAGFTKGSATYSGETVGAGIGQTKKLTLLYLTDSAGQNGAFYMYDGIKLTPYRNLTVTQSVYTVIDKPESILIPVNYAPSRLEIAGVGSVTSYRNIYDREGRYQLIYLMNEDGGTGFFYYDTQSGKVLNYFNESIKPIEKPTEINPKDLPFGARMKRLFGLVKSDDDLMLSYIIIGSFGLVFLALSIIFGVSASKSRRLARFAVLNSAGVVAVDGDTAVISEKPAAGAEIVKQLFPTTAELDAIKESDKAAASQTLEIPKELILGDDADDDFVPAAAKPAEAPAPVPAPEPEPKTHKSKRHEKAEKAAEADNGEFTVYPCDPALLAESEAARQPDEPAAVAAPEPQPIAPPEPREAASGTAEPAEAEPPAAEEDKKLSFTEFLKDRAEKKKASRHDRPGAHSSPK